MSVFQIYQQQPNYDPTAVQPMRDELIAVGFEELLNPEDVDRAIGNNDGQTVLAVINSVCGCAAGSARPGVCEALQHKVIPDKLMTVFAGQDKASTAHLREKYLTDIPPSSPFMALFRDGEPLFLLPRHHIEGRTPEEISQILTQKFDEFCSKEGPSITPQQYAQVVHARACGSKIPRFNG
ncbi:MAG: BrxA/BrxB family bacilliredoxin [Aliifodinibius sp.]|nr:BrxA/BrxB family bacilliredoxin [Fodinibius sp.]NIV16703.1 BrxA/BrxB family bacilliredoxin [Fodinibius sp.]NIY30270.1 BrxA/BrxB family bacilliredoxin [Fodinibius sp.]